MKMNFWSWLAIIFLIVGGLNLGFVGFFGVNVIGSIFGDMSSFTRFIYAIIGLSALYEIIMLIAYGGQEEISGEMSRRAT